CQIPASVCENKCILSRPAAKSPEMADILKWTIIAATGRCFGDKDFRGGLENGILLCELLSSIKPGLVKKINRLPTPIAGLGFFRQSNSMLSNVKHFL
uniref:Calponin-homology (CH) domain-containing protein n=1 Tax=Sander lucioperca TaxID=283035 RepID=A0A8D0CTN1_SANLU